jgi:hypothetical protein
MNQQMTSLFVWSAYLISNRDKQISWLVIFLNSVYLINNQAPSTNISEENIHDTMFSWMTLQ